VIAGLSAYPSLYVKKFFNTAVERVEKERASYVQFFQPAHMESYRENASTFRGRLVRKVPMSLRSARLKTRSTGSME
jgi:hypothetical protein